jgi:hypothetical protein
MPSIILENDNAALMRRYVSACVRPIRSVIVILAWVKITAN